MKRTRAERRHHRRRVIHNRLQNIKHVFNGRWGLGDAGPGGLSKNNTVCSCFMCSPPREQKRFGGKVHEEDWE